MASTKADNNRLAWTYSSDDGNDYAISAKAVYVADATDGEKYGGNAASDDNRRIPKEIKPRKVKMRASGKPDRWMVAYDTTATIWTTPGTTLTLDVNGVDTAYSSTKTRRNEKSRDTTRQAT
jgi:hypothetical protein